MRFGGRRRRFGGELPSFRERLRRTAQVGPALRLIWSSAPRWTVFSGSLALVEAVVPLAALYLVKLVVDAVTSGVTTPGSVPFSRVGLLLGAAAAVAVVGAAARALAAFATEAQGHLVTDHVLDLLHQRSIEADLSFYEDPEYFDTLHQAQREGPNRPTRILTNLLAIGRGVATLAGILLLLASVHWGLAAVLALAALPAMLVRMRFAERLYRWRMARAGTERQAWYINYLLTAPMSAKEVRVYGLGPHLAGRSHDLRERLRGERLQLARTQGAEDLVVQSGATIVVYGSLAFIALLAFRGSLTIGDLVMYFGAVQRAQTVLQGVFSGLAGLYEDNLFLEALTEFLDLRPQITAPAQPAPLPTPIRKGLALDRVSFTYPRSERASLHDVSFHIEPGEMVALVGANGSGKTTLVKLLCRLYDPTGGVVTLDGTDVKTFDPRGFRRLLGVVFQDFLVFHGTAGENIWFGDPAAPPDDQRVADAAAASGAAEVIGKLPKGFDTPLGNWMEPGTQLSGGEWQKLALARAFYSKAPFLVLDEPTSALDAESEARVFETLRKVAGEKGILVISHRFSTVRMADRICVLDDGRVVESGSHDELMLRQGIYARLYELQARAFGDPGADTHRSRREELDPLRAGPVS